MVMPSSEFFADHFNGVLFEDLFVIYASRLSFYCFLVCFLRPCGHLLGKGSPLGSLVCGVLLCFCNFPIWCLRAGVVLDCISYLAVKSMHI